MNTNYTYYISSIVYVIASIVLGAVLHNGLVIFLGWNMVLATFPLIISQLFSTKKSKIFRVGLAFLYIIFFPNTIYIMTDLIHLQNYEFFIEYPNIYALQISDWIVFLHLLIGALLASKIGIVSIQSFENKLFKTNRRYQYLILTGLFLLSSIAIFIGRFLRFNSWEIFKIGPIFKELWSHQVFLAQFICLGLILHFIVYFMFREKKSHWLIQSVE